MMTSIMTKHVGYWRF